MKSLIILATQHLFTCSYKTHTPTSKRIVGCYLDFPPLLVVAQLHSPNFLSKYTATNVFNVFRLSVFVYRESIDKKRQERLKKKETTNSFIY